MDRHEHSYRCPQHQLAHKILRSRFVIGLGDWTLPEQLKHLLFTHSKPQLFCCDLRMHRFMLALIASPPDSLCAVDERLSQVSTEPDGSSSGRHQRCSRDSPDGDE